MEVNIKGRSLQDVIFGRVVWVGRQLVDTSSKYTAVNILKELIKKAKKK